MTMGSTRHTLGGTNATMRSTFGRSRTSHSASRRRVDPKTGQMIETFTGRTQPTVSRADTKVWLLTKRPGPGEYKTASSLGRQLDARKVTAPRSKFGKSERYNFHNSVWRLTPSQGPKYRTPSTFGKQTASTARTAASHSFGTSTRDSALKQYGVWSV